MAKSLLYKLFGVGKISDPLLSQLQSEGLVLLDDGVKGSVTYRDFRKPGRRDSWRRQWYTAAIALTKERLFAAWYSNPIINVPLADERLRSMRFSLEGDETLCVTFDASLFHSDWSGTIEYRFRTPLAHQFLDHLNRQTA